MKILLVFLSLALFKRRNSSRQRVTRETMATIKTTEKQAKGDISTEKTSICLFLPLSFFLCYCLCFVCEWSSQLTFTFHSFLSPSRTIHVKVLSFFFGPFVQLFTPLILPPLPVVYIPWVTLSVPNLLLSPTPAPHWSNVQFCLGLREFYALFSLLWSFLSVLFFSSRFSLLSQFHCMEH